MKGIRLFIGRINFLHTTFFSNMFGNKYFFYLCSMDFWLGSIFTSQTKYPQKDKSKPEFLAKQHKV